MATLTRKASASKWISSRLFENDPDLASALGLDPWGGRFDDARPIAEIRGLPCPSFDENPTERVRAAGRIILRRIMGKIHFLQLRDRTGDVQVMLPANASFSIDARTHSGDIESDFSQVQVNSSGNQTTATGAVGTNGVRVEIVNDYGSIEIRKAG